MATGRVDPASAARTSGPNQAPHVAIVSAEDLAKHRGIGSDGVAFARVDHSRPLKGDHHLAVLLVALSSNLDDANIGS